MFLPRQLFFPTLIIFLLSCNATDKQKEQTNSHSLIKDTIITVPKQAEIFQDTAIAIAKQTSTIKIKKSVKSVLDHSNIQVQTSLENDFKTIDQGFQSFELNTNLDTTLLCKQGTVLTIHRSSFLIASNLTEVKGRITLQVKEYYSISDILSARLTTHSGDNILETGGMLFIQASSNGELCKLKDYSPIEIFFPFSEKKDSMLLFSGIWTNQKVNWQLLPPNEANQKEIVEEIATFPGGATALNKFMLKNLVYPDSLADMGIGGMVQMDFIIDETGKAKDVNFKNRSQKGFRDAILNTFSKMPRWKPAKRNGIPIKSTYSQAITFYNEEQNINDTIFKKDFESTISDSNINSVKTADIRQYIFSTSKLGWINCDRFYNSPKPRTDFYVDCGNYTELDIKLVFHSFKAVLDNYASKTAYKFQNIPDDEVVTVVVVKKINNDTFISLTESNTNSRAINNLVFEQVTMDRLKQKLEQLNKRW
jgi:Gram-negative bacterial TonB protein C-terminal